MSWLDSLREASFRGVRFQVHGHEHETGRRIIPYEAPGVDIPAADDLGRRVPRFTVYAFLVGGDYHLQRDRLIEAAEREGPGELVHPYFGRMDVLCESALFGEHKEAGASCVISLVFLRVSPTRPPITRGDTSGATRAAARALTDASGTAFEDALDLGSRSPAAQEAAADSWIRSSRTFDLIQLRGPFDKIAAWKAHLARITNEIVVLTSIPRDFVAEVRQLVDDLATAYNAARLDFWRVCVNIAHDEAGRAAPLLSGGPAADAGDKAVSDLLARLLAAEACSQAVALTWPTYEDAEAARATLAALLDELREGAGDDAFGELQDLQAALFDGLPPEGVDLPRLSSVTLLRSIPATVFAYRLYGSTGREADVIARSHARNPMFLPAGVPLPVVLDP